MGYYYVRPMRLEDVPQAAEIDKEAFPTFWPPISFKHELLHNRLACYLVVAEGHGDGVPQHPPTSPASPGGWRWLGPLRRLVAGQEPLAASQETVVAISGTWFMFDEAHLTTIAVRASHRGQGLGELILVASLELAMERQAVVMTLEVRVSNTVAQALYDKYSFAKVGVRRGYYTDNNEDALLMTTDKLTAAGYRAEFQQLKEAYLSRWGAERRILSLAG